MFEQPKIIESSLSIYFNRQFEIRKNVGNIEHSLNDIFPNTYSPPFVIPIPDELDPNIPRLIFNAVNAYTQIVISQVNISLNTRFLPEYQSDREMCKKKIKEVALKIYEIGRKAFNTNPLFIGLFTRIDISSILTDDIKIIDYLSKMYLNERIDQKFMKDSQIYDIEIKFTRKVDEQFFSNIIIKNFREWQFPLTLKEIPRFSEKKSLVRGLQILVDYNDRYAFNEKEDYFTSIEALEKIIEQTFNEIDLILNTIGR